MNSALCSHSSQLCELQLTALLWSTRLLMIWFRHFPLPQGSLLTISSFYLYHLSRTQRFLFWSYVTGIGLNMYARVGLYYLQVHYKKGDLLTRSICNISPCRSLTSIIFFFFGGGEGGGASTIQSSLTPTHNNFLHIISWEPEGHYRCSKMFCWEPEGRYCWVFFFKSMVIAPFWL